VLQNDEPEPKPYLTIAAPAWPSPQLWRWRIVTSLRYGRGLLPWVRASLFFALLTRGVYARRPFHGNAYQMLRQRRLQIGRHTLMESGVTLHSVSGQIRLGQRVYLSRGVTVGAVGLVEIGDFALVGPGCYITDADHRFSDQTVPLPDQGMSSKGPTVIEDNVWLGANVVVTSGVRIGRRSVIGANSVVTRDIPAFSVAAGIPATVVSTIDAAAAATTSEEFDDHGRPLPVTSPATVTPSTTPGTPSTPRHPSRW
jgi:acetyltransferase-like isoleucine patch superfamily enzyme